MATSAMTSGLLAWKKQKKNNKNARFGFLRTLPGKNYKIVNYKISEKMKTLVAVLSFIFASIITGVGIDLNNKLVGWTGFVFMVLAVILVMIDSYEIESKRS